MNSSTSRLWTVQFSLVITVTFLFFLCLQMLTAGFPAFVTEFSGRPALGGIMTTAFMFAAIFTRPFVGIYMNRLNMKRTVGIALILVFIFIFLSYGQNSISYLIFLRIVHGVGFGLATTLLATLATNLIPNERLGEGIGYFGMATSLGTTLGPMFALSLLHSFTFDFLIIVTMVLAGIAFICNLFIRNTQPTATQIPSVTKGSVLQYALDKKALLPTFLVMLFYLTFSGVVNFIHGLGEEANLGSLVSVFFLINAVITLILRPFSGRIYDRFGHRYLIYPASFCGIIGLLLLSIANNAFTFIIAAIVYGVAYGIMSPTFQAWAVSRVSPDKKGTANAMALSFMDLGMAVGAASLGGIAGQFNYRTMYGISALLVVALVIIYFLSLRKNSKQKVDKRKAA